MSPLPRHFDVEELRHRNFRFSKRQHLRTHLLLGVYAVDAAQNYSRRQLAKAEAWQQVSRSADFGQPYPVDLPHDAPAQ